MVFLKQSHGPIMVINMSTLYFYIVCIVCYRSKYFRGRKVFGDWDVRVEQAEFSEINLAAYTDSGTVVDIQVNRNGTKVVR